MVDTKAVLTVGTSAGNSENLTVEQKVVLLAEVMAVRWVQMTAECLVQTRVAKTVEYLVGSRAGKWVVVKAELKDLTRVGKSEL